VFAFEVEGKRKGFVVIQLMFSFNILNLVPSRTGHDPCLDLIMSQLSFFDDPATDNRPPLHLLDYRPAIFSSDESLDYLETFIRETPWVQRTAQLYGKEVITPRLTAFYGDPAATFSRSDQIKNPLPWTPQLSAIKSRIEPLARVSFNAVLLNYYRDGNDSVAWHSDNDGIPGRNRIVASVSFGQPRKFDVRKTNDHGQKYSIELASGSYLLMHGEFQDQWEHRIAKSAKPMRPRVNLTFRML
jgi:alkylated DNA repair dioxygenase AlkB